MVYKDNIPQPADLLSISQGDILENFKQLNIVYGTDHVAYDSAADVGKHKTVTYVTQASEPNTLANEVKSFSFVPLASIGELEFSRGPQDALSTPVTNLHGTESYDGTPATSTKDLLDLTGLNVAFATVWAYRKTTSTWTSVAECFYNSTLGLTLDVSSNNNLRIQNTGNIIQLRNASGQSFDADWTIRFHRLS